MGQGRGQGRGGSGGYRRLLEDPDGEIALGLNTHDLIIKLALHPRPATSGRASSPPTASSTRCAASSTASPRRAWRSCGCPRSRSPPWPDGLAAAVDDRTALVAVSAVMFMTSQVVPDLDAIVPACERHGAELLVDAYHALGPVPFPIHDLGLGSAWVTGGGYKYLQLGEGNAFLRPPRRTPTMPGPIVTGWFAEFADLTGHHEPNAVTYAPGALRFATATYDPVSNYRGARVLRFFAEQGLTAAFLRDSYQRQLGVLVAAFDALDLSAEVITRDRGAPVERLGGFLSLIAPRAGELQRGAPGPRRLHGQPSRSAARGSGAVPV